MPRSRKTPVPSLRKETEFKCDFDDCFRVFKSSRELIDHKEDDPKHEYCRKCNLNFPEWEDLIQHRFADPAHKNDKLKVCPLCGAEYRTEGARNRHITERHPVKHKVVCYGCKQIFGQPSLYINHIEAGHCSELKRTQIQPRIQHKMVVNELLQIPSLDKLEAGKLLPTGDNYQAGSHSQRRLTGSDVSTLLHESVLSSTEDNRSSIPQTPNTSFPDSFEPDIYDRSMKHVEQWAEQVDSRAAPEDSYSWGEPAMVKSAPSDRAPQHDEGSISISRAIELATSQFRPPPVMCGDDFESELSTAVASLSKTRSGAASATSAQRDCEPQHPGQGGTDGDGNLFRLHFWDPSHPRFNAEKLYSHNRNGYICPHPQCDYLTVSGRVIREHLMNEHIAKIRHTCPECRRNFGTLSSLVAHATSATRKCKFRQRESYRERLSILTGGFISAYEDRRDAREGGGHVMKYTSTKPEEIDEQLSSVFGKAVTIGTRL